MDGTPIDKFISTQMSEFVQLTALLLEPDLLFSAHLGSLFVCSLFHSFRSFRSKVEGHLEALQTTLFLLMKYSIVLQNCIDVKSQQTPLNEAQSIVTC